MYSPQQSVSLFLQILNAVKLYHWKTTSYAQHKATDELYTNLNTNIDSFIEVMLGKTGGRIHLGSQRVIHLADHDDIRSFTKEIEMFKQYLMNMSKDTLLSNNSDLLNIRDEILGNLNQFTYLLTFTH
jgi:DNA-binding ferritin-like protein